MDGWEEVLEVVLVQRSSALKRYAFLLCGDEASAEDLMQEAFVRALSRRFAGRHDAPATEAYIRQTMVNLSIDRHRGLARWRRFVPVLAGREGVSDPMPEVAARAEIIKALTALSPRQRACVVLRFYEDLSVAEISVVLGCAQGSVKRYLSDALTRLKPILMANGVNDGVY